MAELRAPGSSVSPCGQKYILLHWNSGGLGSGCIESPGPRQELGIGILVLDGRNSEFLPCPMGWGSELGGYLPS